MKEFYKMVQNAAIKAASNCTLEEDNKKRSSRFISNLHLNLKDHYTEFNDIKVFSREMPNKDFHRNEYLFDILIAEIATTKSIVHKKDIPFLKKAILALESEFAENTRESIIDFSKLNCCNADYKIMILPNTKKPKNYLTPIKAMIDKDSKDNTSIIFVDHPSKWKAGKDVETKFFYWDDGKFEKIIQ